MEIVEAVGPEAWGHGELDGIESFSKSFPHGPHGLYVIHRLSLHVPMISMSCRSMLSRGQPDMEIVEAVRPEVWGHGELEGMGSALFRRAFPMAPMGSM
jgi:hypothetical protein